MYQSMKELRAAPFRAALITITVGMIAVMVTFLSALAAGLSHQSVSALDELYDDDSAVVVAEGSSSLSASVISGQIRDEVDAWAKQNGVQVREVTIGRARVNDTPVTVLSDPALAADAVRVNQEIADRASSNKVDLEGASGSVPTTIASTIGDKWIDHQAVILAGDKTIRELSGGRDVAPAALVVDESHAELQGVDGAQILRDKERNNLSASYQGEQSSLSAMTTMLYVISALVVGAFFTVWTVQRMRGVAITAALGASRKVLIADSLAQAIAVLLIGVGGGVALTALAGWALTNSGAMPIVISPATTVIPGAVLAATGIVGAVLALIPVVRVDPTTALANA